MSAIARQLRLAVAAVAMGLWACGDETPAKDPAGEAARTYYEHLASGRFADYFDGVAGADSLPESYREQLLANTKQFAAQLKADHGGISRVEVNNTVADTARRQADVFLLITFADSTKEEIVVPMIEQSAGWKMR